MPNAVIYARFSSHNQREESIEGQVRECTDFAIKNGFTVVGEYCDRAISGKTDNRAEFQRLMRDSEKGHFQAVIMYTLDRFARNRYDSAMYKAKLKKNGVKVYYAKQSIPDTPEGIILESVLEGYAEYYSENLSRNIKRGMLENAMKCKCNGNGLCLGYKVGADGRFELDPVGAKVVQEIFQLYADGMSATQIVEYCNEKGYRTFRKQPFNKNSLKRMLKNDKYIGVYRYGDIVVEDGVPPIVEKELFHKVQSMVKHNSVTRARTKAVEDYLLTTKLICGHCGSFMIGESGTSKNGKLYHYYKCGGKKNRKTDCDKKPESKDKIEEFVVKYTVKTVLTDENIEDIAEKAVELVNKEAADMTVLNAYEASLKDTKKRISNILDMMEQGIVTPSTKDRLMELESYERDLVDNIEREKMKKPSLSKERVMFWLESFKDGEVRDINYCRRVIDTLINKVYVYDLPDGGKRFVFTFNTSQHQTSEVSCSDLESVAPPNSAKSNTLFFINSDVFGFVIDIERP